MSCTVSAEGMRTRMKETIRMGRETPFQSEKESLDKTMFTRSI